MELSLDQVPAVRRSSGVELECWMVVSLSDGVSLGLSDVLLSCFVGIG